MKKTLNLLLLTLTFIPLFSQSQSGLTRNEAILINPESACIYNSYTTNSDQMWFKFVCQSEQISIDLVSAKFGNNIGHIHNIKLYKGTETAERTFEELPYNNESKKLRTNLNAGNLEIGATYYIKADRKAKYGHCDKSTCTSGGSTSPATFDLCVKKVPTYIPIDFNNEPPSISHSYEMNRGQLHNFNGDIVNEVLMYSSKSSPQIYIGDQFTSFMWVDIDNDETTTDKIHRVDMELVGGQLNETVLKSEELSSHSNYFYNDNQKGILDNRSYSRVIRKNVYPNIDQHFYSNSEGLKMYFVVNPGGNYEDIKFKFSGGAVTQLTSSGGLILQSVIDEIEFQKAIIYNVNPAGNNVPMPPSGNFVDLGNSEFGFAMQNYPLDRTLVIQIQTKNPKPKGIGNAEWCTYLGGVGDDYVQDMSIDDENNIYVVGGTTSPDFPILGGPDLYQGNFHGSRDGFISKFDPLYEMKWSTFVGSTTISNDVSLKGIACDPTSQSIYISGSGHTGDGIGTYPYAPNPNAFVETFGNVNNPRCFFARFNDDLGMIEWMTMYPAKALGLEQKIDVDNNGNVYFAIQGIPGQAVTYTCNPTGDNTMPMCIQTPGVYEQPPSTPVGGQVQEIYLGKFNNQLELVWSTALGGEYSDFLYDMKVDDVTNHMYVIGTTKSGPAPIPCPVPNNSSLFPLKQPTSTAYLETYQSAFEGFITRFNLDGTLDWSTYYGGTADDEVTGIDFDAQGNIVIAGASESYLDASNSCLPPVATDPGLAYCWPPAAYNQLHQNGYSSDAFIAKFDVSSLGLVWGTRIGGPMHESSDYQHPSPKVSINNDGRIYLFGQTESGSGINLTDYQSSFPTLDATDYYFTDDHADYTAETNGDFDTYIMGFRNNGLLFWSTYFGGTGLDSKTSDHPAEIIALNDKIYLSGSTNSDGVFPLNEPNTPNPYYQDLFLPPTTSYRTGFLAQVRLDHTSGLNNNSNNPLDETEFKLYPNPNNGYFQIDWLGSTNDQISIKFINQLGQIISSEKISSKEGVNSHIFDYQNISSGFYVLLLDFGISTNSYKVIIR